MWIPSKDRPEISLSIRLSLRALEAAVGRKIVLREIYNFLIEKLPNGIPSRVKVATESGLGIGIIIDPAQACCLDMHGLLGEQQSESVPWKEYYDQTYYWRWLDMVRLYELIEDTSLPSPALM